MVGKNIKKLRSAKGLTQEELAAKLNVTRQALSSWETGRTEPDIDTLERISQVLEVSIEDVSTASRELRQRAILPSLKKAQKLPQKTVSALDALSQSLFHI